MEYKNLSVEEIIQKIRPRRRVENSLSQPQKKALVRELIRRNKTGEIPADLLREVLYDLLPPYPYGRKQYEKLQIDIAEKFIFPQMVSEFANELETFRWLTDETLLLSLQNAIRGHNNPENIGFARALMKEVFDRGLEQKVPSSDCYDFIRSQIPQSDHPFFRKIAEDILIKIVTTTD